MKFLTDEQLSELLPAETASFPSPVPTQIVSSDEYMPVPQSAKQREVEARLKELSDRFARQQGLSRRRFFQTAAGMAASFVAMNHAATRLADVLILGPFAWFAAVSSSMPSNAASLHTRSRNERLFSPMPP